MPITLTALLCTAAVLLFFFLPSGLMEANNHDATSPGPVKVITAKAPAQIPDHLAAQR